MDSYPRSREVEKPKPAKERAMEHADFLHALAIGGDQESNVVMVSRKLLDRTVGILREVAGGRG